MAASHLPMIPCERHLPAWPLVSSVIFLSQLLPRKGKEGALRLALGRRSVQKAQLGLARPHPYGAQRGRMAPLETPERPRLCHGARPRGGEAKRGSGGSAAPAYRTAGERPLLKDPPLRQPEST